MISKIVSQCLSRWIWVSGGLVTFQQQPPMKLDSGMKNMYIPTITVNEDDDDDDDDDQGGEDNNKENDGSENELEENMADAKLKPLVTVTRRAKKGPSSLSDAQLKPQVAVKRKANPGPSSLSGKVMKTKKRILTEDQDWLPSDEEDDYAYDGGNEKSSSTVRNKGRIFRRVLKSKKNPAKNGSRLAGAKAVISANDEDNWDDKENDELSPKSKQTDWTSAPRAAFKNVFNSPVTKMLKKGRILKMAETDPLLAQMPYIKFKSKIYAELQKFQRYVKKNNSP